MKSTVLVVVLAVASSGCFTYATYKRGEREPVRGKTALTILGVETGIGIVTVGLPISTCDESCPPGAGNDSVGEVAASLAWGLGFVFLADLALAGLVAVGRGGMPQ